MTEFAISGIEVGQLNALVKNLRTQMGIEDSAEAVRRINSGEWVVKQPDLLKRVATVKVSAVQRFVADDEAAKRANVGYRSEQFRYVFGDKVEQNVPAGAVVSHSLKRDSVDPLILTELGDNAQSSLAHLFELMEKQKQGQEGTLLVNGRANIVYAIANDGNVWAVSAYWNEHNRYWHVYAYSVDDPRPWDAGCQILSCDS